MIHSVRIQNFQSHKDTSIEFGNNVNIFIGHSDCGKTAVLRALRWVITNKPSGDAFRSTWGGTTKVTLTLKNGTIVTRSKGSSINEYTLQLLDGDELLFKAFGSDVPSEIVDALGFTSINLQNQLDSPYLLSETPGSVAKHFNKIAKLEKIDFSIQRVQSSITKLNQSINTNNTNIDTYKEAYKDFDYLKTFEATLDVLEKKVKSKDEKDSELLDITGACKSLSSIYSDIEHYSNIMKNEELVNTLETKYEEHRSIQKDRKKLKAILITVEDVLEDQKALQGIISCESLVNKLSKLLQDYEESDEELNNLKYLINSINRKRSEQETALKSLKILEERFDAEFPDFCPLCGAEEKDFKYK